LLAAAPDLTIAELRRRLAAEGIATSRSAIGRLLVACGLTRKKTYGPPRLQVACSSWLSSLRQRIRPLGAAAAKMEIRAFRSC